MKQIATICNTITDLKKRGQLWFSGLAIVLLCFSASTQASPQATFEASYDVENDYITGGIATLRLARHKDGGFVFSLRTKPTGIFKLTKNGRILEQAQLGSLDPPFLASRYDYVDQGRSERSYLVAFDREAGTFTHERNGTSSTHELEPLVLDRLSVTLELLHKTKADPDFETLDIRVLDGNKTETVTYSNRGTETLTTPLGKFNAVRVLKDRINSTRETVIWLAEVGQPGIMLPLKIEQYKKGSLSLRLKITDVRTLD